MYLTRNLCIVESAERLGGRLQLLWRQGLAAAQGLGLGKSVFDFVVEGVAVEQNTCY